MHSNSSKRRNQISGTRKSLIHALETIQSLQLVKNKDIRLLFYLNRSSIFIHKYIQMLHRNPTHRIHHIQPPVLGHHGDKKNNLLSSFKSQPAVSTLILDICNNLHSASNQHMTAYNLATSTEHDLATLMARIFILRRMAGWLICRRGIGKRSGRLLPARKGRKVIRKR